MLFLSLGDLGGTELGGSGLGLSGGLSEAASPKAPAKGGGVLPTGVALRLQLSSGGGARGALALHGLLQGPSPERYPRPFCKKESKPASSRAHRTEVVVL